MDIGQLEEDREVYGFAQTPQRRAEKLAQIQARGNIVAFGDPYTLQLDIDTLEGYRAALGLIARFAQHVGVKEVREHSSRSANWHLYARLTRPMNQRDRIFWQLALGSDPVREALNMAWLDAGHTEECFLEEVPHRVSRVIPWSEIRGFLP